MNENSYKSLYIKCCRSNEFTVFEGTALATATGFLVKEQERIFLITNRHVVTGRDIFSGKILDKKMSSEPNELIVEIPYIMNNNIENYWANPFRVPLYKTYFSDIEDKLWFEHPIYKDKIDIVAIDITSIYKDSIENLKNIRKCNNVEIPFYEINLSNNYTPKVTEQVSIVGYPFGYSTTDKKYLPTWSNATIASEYEQNLTIPLNYIDDWNSIYYKLQRENDEQEKVKLKEKLENMHYFEAPTFLVDSKTRKGQSGSPVIVSSESKGTLLLGIYSGRVNEESDLGYVWKSELIKEIIENAVI